MMWLFALPNLSDDAKQKLATAIDQGALAWRPDALAEGRRYWGNVDLGPECGGVQVVADFRPAGRGNASRLAGVSVAGTAHFDPRHGLPSFERVAAVSLPNLQAMQEARRRTLLPPNDPRRMDPGDLPRLASFMQHLEARAQEPRDIVAFCALDIQAQAKVLLHATPRFPNVMDAMHDTITRFTGTGYEKKRALVNLNLLDNYLTVREASRRNALDRNDDQYLNVGSMKGVHSFVKYLDSGDPQNPMKLEPGPRRVPVSMTRFRALTVEQQARVIEDAMNRRKVNVDARLGVGRFIGVIFETDPSIVRLRAEGNYQAIYDLRRRTDLRPAEVRDYIGWVKHLDSQEPALSILAFSWMRPEQQAFLLRSEIPSAGLSNTTLASVGHVHGIDYAAVRASPNP